MEFAHHARLRTALLTLAVLIFAIQAPAVGQFFGAMEDLPAMSGLVEDPSARVVFDKPQGRIVQITASGDVAPSDVRRFYDEVLPRLGWTRTSAGIYRREGEVLRLRLRRNGDRLTVRFSLSPD